MDNQLAESMEGFLRWRKSYQSCVLLIDEQHRGILNFINAWHRQLKREDSVAELFEFLKDKFEFLIRFSKGHLRFESEMLKLLKEQYGFPEDEYQSHLGKHRWFIEAFLVPLIKQLTQNKHNDPAMLEGLASDGLMDTARWWYDHIRAPLKDEGPGPDHIYRDFLSQLPLEERLKIVNQMTVFIALHGNTFWLKDILGAPE